MSILLTAFKGIHNSSYQLIRDCENDKLFFTNSFDGIDRDIEDFDFSPYSVVFMFGIDTQLKDKIRIEPQAVLGGNVRKTVYDIGDFVKTFESNSLQVTVAKRATSYLCNYAYYRVLEKTGDRALFIHIPPERYLTMEMQASIHKVIQSVSGLL